MCAGIVTVGTCFSFNVCRNRSTQLSGDLEEEGRKATRNAEVKQKHNALLQDKVSKCKNSKYSHISYLQTTGHVPVYCLYL